MTVITIKKSGENITGFMCYGHTGYAESGKDIVCSAISSITQSTCLGITKILKIDAQIQKDEDSGLLSLDISKCTKEQICNSQVLLETMYASLRDLAKEYKKFIKILA